MRGHSLLNGLLLSVLAACLSGASPADAGWTVQPGAGAASDSATTLENLQGAFSRATRDVEMLSRFARAADDQGYTQVGSLFRAGARSRQIHLSAFERLIKAAGGKPKAEALPMPEYKSVKESLGAVRDAALAERDKPLAAAMTRAASDKDAEARKAFLAAREGLYELSQYCKDALADVEAYRKGKRDYFVCKGCGYLLDRLSIRRCPVDNSPREDFEKVN
ncbi:MAG: rubrerythrin family protein [Phycisphaerae bacterium]|nr:rubrerythrin family protein [Phycisphaerae bacterium]